MSKMIGFKISDEDAALLQIEAEKRGMTSLNLTAKEVLIEGVTGYSTKEQYLLSRIDNIDELMQQTLKATVMSLMGLMMPVDMPDTERMKIKKQIEEHLLFLSRTSESVVKALKEGSL